MVNRSTYVSRNRNIAARSELNRHERPIRVLVADAKPMVRAGLRTILEPAGFVVTSEARHSQEILSKLESQPVDVLALDPALPGRGLDIVPDVKKEHPRTAVLVYAPEAQQQFLLAAIKSGVDGVLFNEADSHQILQALERLSAGEQFIPDSLAAVLARYVRGTQQPHEKLSSREHHILLRIGDGKSLKEIAGELGIAAKTVSSYKRRISDKMGCQTNAELIQYVVKFRQGVEPPSMN